MRHFSKEHKTAHVDPKKGFRIHLLVFVLVNPVIWITWQLTDNSYPWPLWQTMSWTVGLLFHYLGVYVFKKRIPLEN